MAEPILNHAGMDIGSNQARGVAVRRNVTANRSHSANRFERYMPPPELPFFRRIHLVGANRAPGPSEGGKSDRRYYGMAVSHRDSTSDDGSRSNVISGK